MNAVAARPRRQAGISKLEFSVSVAIVGVLAFLLQGRLLNLEAETERLEVDLTLRNARVGLQLAIGERLMRGEEHRLGELLETNPIKFLGREPQGYIGETTKRGGPGSWRYDERTRTLSYRPRQPAAFGGTVELHWQMRSSGVRGGRVSGIRIEAVPPG